MSKAFRTLGQVAGVVAGIALIGSGIGAALGGTMVLTGVGAASSIAAVAGAVSAVSGTIGQLTAKKPGAVGSINERIIGANNPMPYLMGRAYSGGVEVVDEAWGGKVDKVQNPYSFTGAVYSCCGPCDAIESYVVDWNAITVGGGGSATGYYAGFLYVDSQLGARPEASALSPQWAGCPNWGSAYKLSSMLAVGWSAKFDKKGKVFATGLPPLGIVARGVKVYDPRLDSTFPGGSGACRLGDETTYVYSDSPALHAGTYAYGRWVNGELAFGVGYGDAVDFSSVAAWANLCDANGWTIGGTIFEPGDKWANLKRICMAGGGEPINAGGTLRFNWYSPRVSLDTIHASDLAPGALESTAMRGWRERVNTITPKFRSEDHQWSDWPADPVSVEDFVSADGEEKSEEVAYELVTDVDQASELALYDIYERREAGPFTVTVGPRLQAYRPGDTLTLPTELELWPTDIDAVVTGRSLDPSTGYATLELKGETPSKHEAVLGTTGSTTPGITPPAPGAADEAWGQNLYDDGALRFLTKTVNYPLSSDDTSVSIAAFDGVLSNGDALGLSAGSVTGLDEGTTYGVFWDTIAEEYVATEWPADTEMATRTMVFIGAQATSTGGVFDDPEPPPPGHCVSDDTLILLAEGGEIAAADIAPGTVVRTRHERTMAWGDWPVLAVSFADEPVFACTIDGGAVIGGGPVTIRATADHRFLIGGRWVCAKDIGTEDGSARVAKITVAEAHTYVSAGVISHNIKAGDI